MFRFLHAADLHLDSPLRGLEQYEGAPVQEIRDAAGRALENLVDLAIRERVAFVVIAGDVYDGDWQDYNTGLFFVRQLSRLSDAGIPTLLIAGNHDARNKMTRSLRLPPGTTFFGAAAPETVRFEDLGVAVHGQSFATQAVTEDLSAGYPMAIRDAFNLGVLHTCASGSEGHDPYAQCTIEGLKAKGYDYWALGHVHQRQVLAERPFIAFSGNLQGRHVRETGPKGALLVDVADDRSVDVHFHPLDVLRWEVAEVDVGDVESADDVIDVVRERLERLRDDAEGRTLAVRVVVRGATAAHRQLTGRTEHWMQEIRSIANQLAGAGVWVEKIRFRTADPATSGRQEADDVPAIPEGAIEELTALFDQAAAEDGGRAWVAELLDDVLRKLPDDVRVRTPLDDPLWSQELIDEARTRLMRRLLDGGSGA